MPTSKFKANLTYGIHWFRRDLRVHSNPALMENLKRHDRRVVGVFFFDSKFLSRSDFSHNRFGFFLKTLAALRIEIETAGGDLLVLDGGALEGFPCLLDSLRSHGKTLPTLCTFNRDYEPFARDRDAATQ